MYICAAEYSRHDCGNNSKNCKNQVCNTNVSTYLLAFPVEDEGRNYILLHHQITKKMTSCANTPNESLKIVNLIVIT